MTVSWRVYNLEKQFLAHLMYSSAFGMPSFGQITPDNSRTGKKEPNANCVAASSDSALEAIVNPYIMPQIPRSMASQMTRKNEPVRGAYVRIPHTEKARGNVGTYHRQLEDD